MICTPSTFLLKRKYTFWTPQVINLHLFNHLCLFFFKTAKNTPNNLFSCNYYRIWQKNLKPQTIRYTRVARGVVSLWTSKLTQVSDNNINSNYLIALNTIFAKQSSIKPITLRYTLSYTHFILFQQSLFTYTYLRYFIGNALFRPSQFFLKKNLLFFKKQTLPQIPSLQKFL